MAALKGKTAVVTGGSRGIGRTIVERLARDGANVVFNYARNVEAGHEVAVHGWEHRCLLLRGPRATEGDLTRARDLIAAATGEMPRWYRPPYGVLSASALYAVRRLGLTPVLWTNWGRDWEHRATPGSVLSTLTRDLAGGGTVLLHDSDCTSAPGSWRTTLGALPALLDEVHARGLTVGPLRDHFEPAGVFDLTTRSSLS